MVGIDVSKRELTCTLVDAQTHERVWMHSFPNTPEGIRELLRRTPFSTPLVLEPTGRYSALVARIATDEGYTVYLAPTKKARDFLKSVSPRVKSDPVDSKGLAQFALSRPLERYPLKAEIVERLHQLLALRRSLSRQAAKLTLQRQEMPYAEALAKDALADLRKHIYRVDAEISRHLRTSNLREDAERLREVPGFGPIISTALVACLTHKRFAESGQFVAYAGLDITVRESGTRKGKTVISHQGDAELRRLLYLAAQANVRIKDSPFREQYLRERDKGLPTTAALCAVARKLARLSWSLVKHKTHYDPQRVYSQ
jgi:transposase